MGNERGRPPVKRLVWRMSERAPMGEIVDATKLLQPEPAPPSALPEVSSGGWVVSSFDLLSGADVIEGGDGDTVPGDLLDELFHKPGQPGR
jgi:hypothetical protein